ncbi:MAG: hypothetical protein AAFN92_12900, partial [Bacteroidota bacterium]
WTLPVSKPMDFCFLLPLTLLLFVLPPAPATAQNKYAPEGLRTVTARATYLDTLVAGHQEFRRQEGEIVLTYGYDSPKHRTLQRQIKRRDSLLLAGAKHYLDYYGFPVAPRRERPVRDSLQNSYLQRLQALPRRDSAAMDSLVRQMVSEMKPTERDVLYFRDQRSALLLILGTDPAFTSRCAMIALLLPLYDDGELTLLQTLVYLRTTYRIRHGRELDIPVGTTEAERLEMYRRELSGCQ